MNTVAAIIARNERFYPDADAYVQDERRLSHREYAARVRAVGAALQVAGVRHQDRVAVLSMNSIEYCELLGACEWYGFIATTINFRLSENEISWILTDSAPSVLVFEAQYVEMVNSLRKRHPGIARYICIDGMAPSWALSYAELGSAKSGDEPESTAHDYATLIYTSGTTGRPKGVVSTQRRLAGMARLMSGEHAMAVNGRTLVSTPLFHIGGQNMRLAQAFASGAIVIMRNFDPAAVLRTIDAEQINVLFVVAAQLQMLLDCPELDRCSLASLTLLNVSGAPIPSDLLKRGLARFGAIFVVMYGLTEGMCTTLYRHQLNPQGSPAEIERIGSVGHAMPGGQLKIVDDQDRALPPGTAGEVLLKSDTMLEAYWNNHVATLEALRGGWLHTGDVGYLDSEGYLYLVDRKKDMIISGGENIYCREVEEALTAHPDVTEAAVIGVPDPKWGQAVKAYVVLKSAPTALTGLAPDELAHGLIEHCTRQIARYKCPKAVEIVQDLPRLVTGKVNKVELRKRHAQASAS